MMYRVAWDSTEIMYHVSFQQIKVDDSIHFPLPRLCSTFIWDSGDMVTLRLSTKSS